MNLTSKEAKYLLDFIDLFDPYYLFIEAEIVKKLASLVRKTPHETELDETE